MKKLIVLIILSGFIFSACTKKKRSADYEGQRKRASEAYDDLDRQK